jgi:hypothetical protein
MLGEELVVHRLLDGGDIGEGVLDGVDFHF